MSRRRVRSHLGRALAVAGVVGMATAVAAPAAALEITVETAGWDWVEVHDTALGISDATAFHRDVLGTGVTLKGWTEDAFDAYDAVDGYLSSLGFTHQDPGLSASVFPIPESFTPTPGGGAIVVSRVDGYDLGDGATLDVLVTLEITGSFARWTIDADDGGSGLVTSIWGGGELGSPTTASAVGTDGGVISGPPGLGPIIGMRVASDGVSDVLDLVDPEFPSFESFGARTVVFTLALLDYDPCAEADAIAEMTEVVLDLPTGFGVDLPPVFSECLGVAAPSPLQAGVPIDELLELSLDDALAGGHPRLDGDSYFAYVDLWTSGLGVLSSGLPAGLALEVVEHPVTLLPALRLSGTPLAAGSVDVPLRFYGIRNSPDFAGEMPVAASLRVEVAAAAQGALLPDTGAASAPLLSASVALALAGLVLLGVDRRRVRRSAPRADG